MRGIPLASQYGNTSLNRGKLRIPRRLTVSLILKFSKNSNIVCDWRCDMVRALGRHHPIWMFDAGTVGMIASA